MIISISLLLFTYYFFVDWYSSGECVWHRWRVDPITFLLRCPKRRISAEKMCTRRKEMRDVLMWSRRSFSVFPPLPSRFRTFLHIYFLYFFDGNNLPFVTILRSPLFMRILAQSERTEEEEEKFPSRRRRRLPPHFLHISLYLFIFATSTQLTISIHSMVHL